MVLSWRAASSSSPLALVPGETALVRALLDRLKAGEIVLGDRYFASFFMLADFLEQNVDALFRMHQCRKFDFRRARMDFNVAVDPVAPNVDPHDGAMAKSWLRAAGEYHTPTAFVVRAETGARFVLTAIRCSGSWANQSRAGFRPARQKADGIRSDSPSKSVSLAWAELNLVRHALYRVLNWASSDSAGLDVTRLSRVALGVLSFWCRVR